MNPSRPSTADAAKPTEVAAGAHPPCLLCGGTSTQVLDVFPADEIRRAWAVFNVRFSKETWRVFDELADVRLHECGACGFRFCDPHLAGSGAFYAELEQQKATYYPPDVPEFTRTLAWVKPRNWRTVLDIGCGEGAFLDLAQSAGLQGTGVELNLQAAEVCRRKGRTVHTRPLSELVEDKNVGRFDLVTVFQVLEHVPAPVQFLTEAAKLLAPGGCLSVAVPNDRGIYRICPREPHQWPPHHITRWRLQDLEHLGQVCRLRVLAAGANQLCGREAEHFWRVRNDIARALGRPLLPGGKIVPKVLSLLYRALGLRFLVSGMGTSVYALYQR